MIKSKHLGPARKSRANGQSEFGPVPSGGMNTGAFVVLFIQGVQGTMLCVGRSPVITVIGISPPDAVKEDWVQIQPFARVSCGFVWAQDPPVCNRGMWGRVNV